MDERELIYDWNNIEPEIQRDSGNHPHPVWFDDETLRDGLQSPSARNPTIEQKIELLDCMEGLGIQKVDLGLPGAGPYHVEHIDSMLGHMGRTTTRYALVVLLGPRFRILNLLSTCRQNMSVRYKQVRFLARPLFANMLRTGRWRKS